MSDSDNPKYFIDGKWIESLTAKNMDVVLYPTTTSVPDHKKTIDPISEYQSWHIQMKMLVREAEYAKETGQWKKSQELLHKIDMITKEFTEKRVSL